MTTTTPTQTDIDKANQAFWNEMCGSTFAQYLGITEHTQESLQAFDQGYLGLYPYLLDYIRPQELSGKRVLEIGLGYGTVSQTLIDHGALYTGLDIAEGPVNLVRERLRFQGIEGNVIQGSMLNCPLPDESVDCVISIGCFHHTGNTQRCIDEAYRILKPGGRATIMLYNRFSLRQWLRWPLSTAKAMANDLLIGNYKLTSNTDQKWAYDYNSQGEAAPETEFFSQKQVKALFRQFSSVQCALENIDDYIVQFKPPLIITNNRLKRNKHGNVLPLHLIQRDKALLTWGKTMGLDIYIEAYK
ncbi:MAG: class I SAM-dependent methyltransferase [Cyanobacteria bacterium HKST-UBA06]|nr:class I SAM-dependent methyltransferase [Cyanobacteria bacterium HKST-UBA05]MCA9798734.1 class I SAM-dependent methyltransferase [Cyanobacteria bacterium HKST-UBA04]MCA9807570.1 class I SAM-dependent methyltransferase [Cyanobacteria bacterium HKST-UBA06]MCA9840527.1 class I SAM-dependent methyltransferase [Cyanobacteria bacterium HKST-UBA03]